VYWEYPIAKYFKPLRYVPVSEWVAVLDRNQWPEYVGIHIHVTIISKKSKKGVYYKPYFTIDSSGSEEEL
jgi:hypothetical protein